jgi:membrane-associated phospholipid phosphatase
MVVPDLESWLFGGHLPTAVLQHRLYRPGQPHWWDVLLMQVYGSFFLVPGIVALVARWKNGVFFRHYLAATALMLTIIAFVYAVLPTAPPWLATETDKGVRLDRPIVRIVNRAVEPSEVQLQSIDPNPIAAMPSGHMAITCSFFFAALRFGRRSWWLVTSIYSLLMGVGLVYLGEHYVLDIAAGVLVAWGSWFVVDRVAMPATVAATAPLIGRTGRPYTARGARRVGGIP